MSTGGQLCVWNSWSLTFIWVIKAGKRQQGETQIQETEAWMELKGKGSHSSFFHVFTRSGDSHYIHGTRHQERYQDQWCLFLGASFQLGIVLRTCVQSRAGCGRCHKSDIERQRGTEAKTIRAGDREGVIWAESQRRLWGGLVAPRMRASKGGQEEESAGLSPSTPAPGRTWGWWEVGRKRCSGQNSVLTRSVMWWKKGAGRQEKWGSRETKGTPTLQTEECWLPKDAWTTHPSRNKMCNMW